MIRGNLAVRQLAAFVFTSGDLYPANAGRPVDAEEGITRQREAQARRFDGWPGYQAEVSFKLEFSCGTSTRVLGGRLDGLLERDGATLIEEFKCTSVLPDQADGVDRGQAWLYAGLHACGAAQNDERTGSSYEISVIYIDAETREERSFTEHASTSEALDFLSWALLCYVARIERHQERTAARDAWNADLAFPMPAYRPSQQAIARRVYRTLTTSGNLLLEAPTGSGKSLAVLYPAARAQQQDAQIFFLTSRNAGARAALEASAQIDSQPAHLITLEITAKEKICFVEGMPCDPERCPYAAGYYDRAPAAVNELLQRRYADRAEVEDVARAHEVCPFELSLDTARWADLIVGDYNYLLDPVVRLQRFSGHDELHVLIDEAHQLSARVSDMLSVSLTRRSVRGAADTGHPALARRVASIDRALLKLRREGGQGESEVSDPASLNRAVSRFLEAAAGEDQLLTLYPELTDLYFEAWRWQRSDTWLDDDVSAVLLKASGRQIEVTRLCLDPSRYIAQTLDEYGGVVRFSGTVTPMPLYQRLHGAASGEAERAQSPFQQEQTLVLAVDDIPTFYRQREQGLERLARMIEALAATRPGRYLVAVPSYEYLQQVAAACHPDLICHVQTPGMTRTQTDDVLREFACRDEGILFIVSGGILGESVDFTASALCGVVLVGLGLPPPSLSRDLVAAHFDETEGDGWGQMVAYAQPALVKNVQAAGRLIRSPTDFGVICLVDPRFTSRDVQRFFPGHWTPQRASARDVPALAASFWQGVV